MKLIEVRFHGRGGQGAVTSSQILAIAAFNEGKQCQAFPMFGVERRGAPVQAFTRISDEKINVRSQVYAPQYVVVLDPTLVGPAVLNGLTDKTKVIVNSNKKPKELGLKTNAKVFSVDITKTALAVIGKPFVNIAALGAFAALTGEVKKESLLKAVGEKFEGRTLELNRKAVEAVFAECLKLKE